MLRLSENEIEHYSRLILQWRLISICVSEVNIYIKNKNQYLLNTDSCFTGSEIGK
jgi:hypothetical protein